MTSQQPNRTARIEARIAPEALAIVKRAAEIQGRSVSDFIVSAAQEAAHRTIEETQIIRLAAEDQRAFAEAILDPPEARPALERAAAAIAGSSTARERGVSLRKRSRRTMGNSIGAVGPSRRPLRGLLRMRIFDR